MNLSALPLLQNVTPEALTWFQSKAQDHTYPAGRAVFVEDVRGNAVYFIRSGWLKICRSQGERQITLAVLGTGEVFGEMSILDSATRSSDAIALTPIQLLSLNASDFRDFLALSPQFSFGLLQRLAQRLRFTNQRLYYSKQNPVIRALFALVQFAETQGIATENGLKMLAIDLQDWADMAEVEAEVSQRLLQKLQAEQIIHVDQQQHLFIVKKLERLQQVLAAA